LKKKQVSLYDLGNNWSCIWQVSEYIGQLNEKYSEEQKHMILEMSNLLQVSGNGKKEAISCAGKIESQLGEVNVSHANTKDQMGDILQQWYPSHLPT
jgi:kinesin family protein 11